MTCWILLFIAVAAVCPGLVAAALAGAWTQEQKGCYVKVGVYSMASQHEFNAIGERVGKPGSGKLTDVNLSAYGEYGLSGRLTLVASAPYKRLSDVRTFAAGVGEERVSGLGDLELRLRWKVRERPVVVAMAAGGKIPLGYDAGEGTRVPLGTGELDGDIRLLLGRSLYPVPGYLSGELGYRVRGGRYSDEVFFGLEAGLARGRWLLVGRFTGVRTRGTCGASTRAGLVGDQDMLKLSPGVIYRLRDRVELGLDLIHVASGCNTTAGNTLGMGLAFKR